MKSIYLRNFTATAVLVLTCFLLVAFSCVSIGRIYLIREYKSTMENSAQEVARAAEAISQIDSLNSWLLGMSISSLARSTGNGILITDAGGTVVCCSDRSPTCEHIGRQVPLELISEIEGRKNLVISDMGGLYHQGHYVVTKSIGSDKSGEIIGHVFVTKST